MSVSAPRRYCGRDFDAADLDTIRRIITEDPDRTRAAISRLVCEQLSWKKPNGTLKDMSCRVALLRMQEDGLLVLPPPRQGNGNGKAWRRRTPAAQPGFPVTAPAGEIKDLVLETVNGREASYLWNEYVDRYHYLGYTPLPGAQFRYFASTRGQVVALLGFSASAWKTEPRDRYIGWTREQRENRLHYVVNNSRFLILPWIRSRHLASRLLGMAARRIAADWEARYAYRPVLLETFVEVERFRGTAYKAANWTCVGLTKGRGKLDVRNEWAKPVKSIWLLPLTKHFRRVLCD
jgi:hypothetical protein